MGPGHGLKGLDTTPGVRTSPEMRPSSSRCSLLKFVYLSSQPPFLSGAAPHPLLLARFCRSELLYFHSEWFLDKNIFLWTKFEVEKLRDKFLNFKHSRPPPG